MARIPSKKTAGKTMAFFLCAALALLCLLSSCAKPREMQSSFSDSAPAETLMPPNGSEAGARIALVYTETQKESAFGQEVYSGINHFSSEEGISWNAYLIEEEDFDSAYSTLELAIKGGAQVVVMIGDEMAPFWQKAQINHPGVSYIVFNTKKQPRKGAVVNFDLGQAGYFAGYACVYDGYTELFVLEDEFFSNEASEYINGVMLGADAACRDLGYSKDSVRARIITLLKSTDTRQQQEFLELCRENGKSVFFSYREVCTRTLSTLINTGSFLYMGFENAEVVPVASNRLSLMHENPKNAIIRVLGDWQAGSLDEAVAFYYAGGQDEAFGFNFTKSGFTQFDADVLEKLFGDFSNGVLGDKIDSYAKADAKGVVPKPSALPLGYVEIREMSQREMSSEENGEDGSSKENPDSKSGGGN